LRASASKEKHTRLIPGLKKGGSMRKNIFFLCCLFILIGFASCLLAEEEITITTYYPSPYGTYRQLTADQIAIGSAYRNPTYADGTLYVSGSVGLGTTSPRGDFELYRNGWNSLV
jgi:hypothetical protein